MTHRVAVRMALSGLMLVLTLTSGSAPAEAPIRAKIARLAFPSLVTMMVDVHHHRDQGGKGQPGDLGPNRSLSRRRPRGQRQNEHEAAERHPYRHPMGHGAQIGRASCRERV